MADSAQPVHSLAVDRALAAQRPIAEILDLVLAEFAAETGTVHLLGPDNLLHLQAAAGAIPPPVRSVIERIPIGKGMAGLAVERRQPVSTCNLQADRTGDVRPGAKATGAQGAIVVPIEREGVAVGALGIANQRERTFSPAETERLLAIGRALAQRNAH